MPNGSIAAELMDRLSIARRRSGLAGQVAANCVAQQPRKERLPLEHCIAEAEDYAGGKVEKDRTGG